MNKAQSVLEFINELKMSPGQAATVGAGLAGGSYAAYHGMKKAGKAIKKAIEGTPAGELKKMATEKAKKSLNM